MVEPGFWSREKKIPAKVGENSLHIGVIQEMKGAKMEKICKLSKMYVQGKAHYEQVTFDFPESVI